jgi:hypothetical protein
MLGSLGRPFGGNYNRKREAAKPVRGRRLEVRGRRSEVGGQLVGGQMSVQTRAQASDAIGQPGWVFAILSPLSSEL